jgi:hypothetical protein
LKTKKKRNQSFSFFFRKKLRKTAKRIRPNMNVQKKDTNFLGTFNSRTKIPIVKKEGGKQECKKTELLAS